MTSLIRNSSHGNQIAVIYLDKPRVFRKISRDQYGRSLLRNELRGLLWYAEKIKGDGQSLSIDAWDNSSFTRIDISQVQGKVVNYRKAISANSGYLDYCFDHYISIWPERSPVPCHGDLTLDNILFMSGSKPFFIDWEHFYSDGECWGYDLAYLVLSTLYLPNPKFKFISERDIDVFTKYWTKLNSLKINKDLLEDPVGYFNYRISSASHWIKIKNSSPAKLFPLLIDKHQRELIKQIIDNIR